jgi:hypothetical protein
VKILGKIVSFILMIMGGVMIIFIIGVCLTACDTETDDECQGDDIQCDGDRVRQCSGGSWDVIMTCQYGHTCCELTQGDPGCYESEACQ